MKSLLISLLLIGAHSIDLVACSSFLYSKNNSIIFNKSYDWNLRHGMLVTNKRNMKKTSFSLGSGNQLTWVAKHGSITFNQYGREFPLGGINEKGLAIETLWLSSAQFPPATDPRPALNELQWVQYALDNYSTVTEMIADIKKLKIKAIFASIHHMACDATGECAGFEFIGGRLVISKTGVLTNSTVSESKKYLKKFLGFGGSQPLPVSGYASKNRFARLSSMVKTPSNSFDMLEKVESIGYTQWQITYDLTQKSLNFRLPGLSRTKTMSLALNDIDFSCKKPVLIYNIEKVGNLDVATKLTPYQRADNERILKKSGRHHGLPSFLVKAGIKYPETTKCME